MQPQTKTLFNAVGANGHSEKMLVSDWANYIMEVFANGTPTGTIKFKMSMQDTCDFTAPSTPTNRWAYVGFVDSDTGSPTAGSTGIALAGANATRIVELNVSNADWICAELSGWSAGAFTVIGTATNATR